MIPKIFIGSTMDLQYLRDAVRQAVVEMGLEPVMSEHSEVAFTAFQTAEDACYRALLECHLAVFIIGKRYGSRGKDGVSVTHNEFRVARKRNIPTFSLVDREVLSFRRVFDNSAGAAGVPYPGMEAPEDTFRFVHEITETRPNNAILPFESAMDARMHLRSQIAQLFQELLARHTDPLQAEIRDVLAEVRAIKHSLQGGGPSLEARKLVKAIRLLLDERFKPLRDILEEIQGDRDLEDLIPEVISSSSFSLAMEKITSKSLSEVAPPPRYEDLQLFMRDWPGGLRTATMRMINSGDGEQVRSFVAVANDSQVLVDSAARKYLSDLYSSLLTQLE